MPSSTLADAVNTKRTGLPRLDVVRRFVQACGAHDDLPRWDSAWRTIQARQFGTTVFREPRQLPGDISYFVGRQEVLERLDRLHDDPATLSRRVPLAMIVGPPGVGKTALALRWSHRRADAFRHGHLYVDLRGVAATPAIGATEALPLLLRALGVPDSEIPADTVAQAGLYRSLTYRRRLLIVLDNARDAEQVRPLLPGGPACFTLITSRSRMSGLVAREDGLRLTLPPLRPEEAERLIALMLGDDKAARQSGLISQLARLCGYLPLALRIAAANLADSPHWSLAEYVAQLTAGNRLAKLVVAGDDTTAVRATFDLSYAALQPSARRVFNRLAAVPEPDFTTEDVALLMSLSRAEARRQLDVLAAAHLIESKGPDHYGMHGLVRLYAEKLTK